MRSPTHDGNKKKGVLFLGEGPTQGLDGTTLTAEMKYSIPFFVSLHHDAENRYFFVNSTDIVKFKIFQKTFLVFVHELSGCGFDCNLMFKWTSDFAPAPSKEFLDIQTTIECEFSLKRVRDMIKTYSQLHRTDKYS